MKLSRFFNQIVKFGKERDPRGKNRVGSFEDSALLYGNPGIDIKKIMVGIDIDIGELLLADKIRKAEGLDLVVSHHPQGRAYAVFYEVMRLQVDMLVSVGIDRKVAEELVDERKREVERRVLPANHMRSSDAAKLLGLPFMCVHTPADNHVSYFIERLLQKEKPRRVENILEILNSVAEYKYAAKDKVGPRIILGNPKRPVGKIFVEMTGGTEGSKDVYDKMYKAGIRTLVSMHLGEEHLKKIKDANLNVVIAGHISSDTLGLNLILDRVEKEEKFETIDCSGFRRIRH